MLGVGRIAFGSCLYLVIGCGQSEAGGPRLGVEGGGRPTAGSSGSDVVSNAGSVAVANGGSVGNGASGGTLELAAGSHGHAGGTGGLNQTQTGGSSGESARAGSAGADNPAGLLDIQTILDSYRTFAAQTPEPVSASGYIFNLCRMPTLRETEFLNSIHGDGRYLQDWANPLAAQVLVSGAPSMFPVGSVIVKEKYAGPTTVKPDLVAIGMMIKRSPGFNSAHGDWDYAYYEPALGIVQTAEQSTYCANCHAGAAATDFVYVDGLIP